MGQQTEERPATWEDLVTYEAKRQGIPPALAIAVARKESSLNPNAVGDGGKATGMFQLHAGAASDAGVDASDPMQNVKGGVTYLKQLSDRYHGDVQKMLTAYNGGMDNVDKGSVSPDAQAYAAGILADLSKGTRAAVQRPPSLPRGASAGMLAPEQATGGPATGSEVTALTPAEDKQFQAWISRNKISDLDHPDSHYDYRGFWKANPTFTRGPGQHFPDTFKQHGHPTFSVESKYSTGTGDGGTWNGDTFIPAGTTPAVTTPKNAIVTSDNTWDQFWRQAYAAIPDITGMIGATVGGTVGSAGGPVGTVLGAEAGAGGGGVVGRGIQYGIDTALGRADALRNPRSAGTEATRQMLFEGTGRIFSGIMGRFAGKLAPEIGTEAGKEQAARQGTNAEFGLGLSTATLSDNPVAQRVEKLAQRGLTGYDIQARAQERTNKATEKAISGILDTVGPVATTTGAGEAAQGAVQDAATRGARRLEGSVATNLAPRTGMGTTGEIAETGVQASRTAFARQQAEFNKMVSEAPPVQMGEMHAAAWNKFTTEILPILIENPSLGPKTKEWQQLVNAYRQASKTGSRLELGPETQKLLADAALDKATYAPLRVVNQVLATPAEMSFQGALKLRGTLRDAGKGDALLAGDLAEGLASYFETGDRLGGFKGIRGLLAETHAPYEAAAEAYRTNRALFKTAFVEKATASNPESVLSSLTNAEGRFNASRIKQMAQTLQALPKQYGTPEEIAAGQQAFDTLRAEWFRRDVIQDNVFGLSDRLKKVDPDVLQAWFPDVAGKNVMKQAQVTASAFESKLLADIATADPAKVVDMIGSSPRNVSEFIQRVNGLPGPVRKDELIGRVRRAWTSDNLIAGEPSKIADRLSKADPELIAAWYPKPADIPKNAAPAVQQAMEAENVKRAENLQSLDGLKRIGQALAPRGSVQGMGAYESLAVVSLVGAATRGNVAAMLTTTVGYEALPGFVSWAMYNPKIQRFLLEAANPSAPVTSKVANMIRIGAAFRAAQQQLQQQAPVQPAQETPP